jgi:putative drug exporter of the RND superfamily
VFGKANWALPGWLDRIIPHLNVEGSVESDVAAVAPPAEHPAPAPVAG